MGIVFHLEQIAKKVLPIFECFIGKIKIENTDDNAKVVKRENND